MLYIHHIAPGAGCVKTLSDIYCAWRIYKASLLLPACIYIKSCIAPGAACSYIRLRAIERLQAS